MASDWGRWTLALSQSRRTIVSRACRWSASRVLFVAVALLCLPRPGRALDPSIPVTQYLHETWSADTDAFQGLVHNITQTKDGYLWFSRDGGVVRFDGVSFKVFSKKNVPEMTNTAIQAIMGAPDGSLWIAMPGCTALRYSGGVFQRIQADYRIPVVSPDNAGNIFRPILPGHIGQRISDYGFLHFSALFLGTLILTNRH